MTAVGSGAGRPTLLAFYLPQFHPIPENDEWWEPGFTEWTNVVRAKPQFPGHYQPHLPGELGYYDLRVPEVRQQQADLAAQYGFSGFVYYHYWFHGRRLLERPFDEVLQSGRPDYPFALCWANEEWTRNWDAKSGTVLVEQRFSEEDDRAHIQWLLRAFADPRYLTIDGRPLMLVYRSDLLPDPAATTELWRTEARAAGFPDLYLAMIESRLKNVDPRPLGFDASIGFRSDAHQRVAAPEDAFRRHTVLDYDAAVEAALHRPPVPWKRFPGVMVGWDNTPRRDTGAVIFDGGTPDAYERWLRGTVESVTGVRDEENLIFVAAWNEWAEGNHLEPDRRYGRGYLEATRRALEVGGDVGSSSPPPSSRGAARLPSPPAVPDPDGPTGHLCRLVRELSGDADRVVAIGTSTEGVTTALAATGVNCTTVAAAGGRSAEELIGQLDGEPRIGALVLGDVVERWPEPHRVLAALANWAYDHGKPHLVVSVPNVAHFDTGLLLLSGRWSPAEGPVIGDPVRHFTRATLLRLLERCGWTLAQSDDYESIYSARYPSALADELPEAMNGALRVLAEQVNADRAVERFVWGLTPVGVAEPPATFAEAVTEPVGDPAVVVPPGGAQAIGRYFSSLGLLAGESQVRAEDRVRQSRAQSVRRAVQQALVRFVLPDRWAEEVPLLADTVDELARLYLARSDLAATYEPDGDFDADAYLQWAIADQPMVGAAVARLESHLRQETADAVHAVLSMATAGRDAIDQATELLTDLYVRRPDLRFTQGSGTEVDPVRLLGWAATVGEADDPVAARLAPFRALIESALAGPPERPVPEDGPAEPSGRPRRFRRSS